CSRNYTVAAGDTCDGISRSVSVSTYQLAMLNPVIDDACSNLEIGANLCLGLTDGSDCQTTYTVAGGDTCDGITGQFAINSTFLYMNNPQIDSGCDNIYVGEVLCVGNKVYALPA
ncbi:carbohydrate-binding module family 50 protein, partial [Calocera cornea HHB12733]